MRLTLSRAVAVFRRPRPVRPARRCARTRAVRTLALSIPALALVAWAAWAAVGPATPDAPDEEYAARLRILRAADTARGGRPLGVVIGTSRTTLGFQPELLPDGAGVYWVNGGRSAAGPVLNRVVLARLHRDGVRPAVVVLEVMPVFFAIESREFLLSQLAPRDLPLASWHTRRPLADATHVFRLRVGGAVGNPPPTVEVPRPSAYLPRGGFPHLSDAVSAGQRARNAAAVRAVMEPALRAMTVSAAADRAFRATARSAAAAGARVVLLRAPEGPEFRALYDPAALAAFDAYLEGVSADLGTPVVDARSWLDADEFSDGHHATRTGAAKFTRRLAAEVDSLPARR